MKRILRYCVALLLLSLFAVGYAFAEGRITMKTDMKAGDYIRLQAISEGEVSVEGLEFVGGLDG